MREFRSPVFAVLLFLSLCTGARAQRTVTLGNATVALTGPWKFHIGDSPQAIGAGALLWAQPGFDDSGWGMMDLTPPTGSYDPIYGSSGYVPGWTARGYKGYFGYGWYRLRVNVQSDQTALALKMPDDFNDAYEVYVNGKLIGQFGWFTAQDVTSYSSQPRALPLTAGLRRGPVTIAIRLWMSASTSLVNPDVGGLHGPPVLGGTQAIRNLVHLDWDAVDRSTYSGFFIGAITLLALIVALVLFWLDRNEPAYLWLGLTCAGNLANVVVNVIGIYSTWLDENAFFLLLDAVLDPAIVGLWVVFWAYWFRLPKMDMIHRVAWPLVALLGLSTAMLRAPLYGTLVPVHATVWISPLTLLLKLFLGAALVWITLRGIRKKHLERWLALPAAVMVIVAQYQ